MCIRDRFKWGTTPVLSTGHSDLSGMAFDANGNLLVSFGSYSDDNGSSSLNNCKTRLYGLDQQTGEWKSGPDDYKLQINAVNNNSIKDAEAIMVDHGNRIVVGSDNDSQSGQQIAFVRNDEMSTISHNISLGNGQSNTAMS